MIGTKIKTIKMNIILWLENKQIIIIKIVGKVEALIKKKEIVYDTWND